MENAKHFPNRRNYLLTIGQMLCGVRVDEKTKNIREMFVQIGMIPHKSLHIEARFLHGLNGEFLQWSPLFEVVESSENNEQYFFLRSLKVV